MILKYLSKGTGDRVNRPTVNEVSHRVYRARKGRREDIPRTRHPRKNVVSHGQAGYLFEQKARRVRESFLPSPSVSSKDSGIPSSRPVNSTQLDTRRRICMRARNRRHEVSRYTVGAVIVVSAVDAATTPRRRRASIRAYGQTLKDRRCNIDKLGMQILYCKYSG